MLALWQHQRLILLLGVAVLITLWLAPVKAEPLFQSPTSPVEPEEATTAEQAPPPAEEEAPTEPVEPAEEVAPPEPEQAVEPLPAPTEPPRRSEDLALGDEAEADNPAFTLDQAEFIDTVVVGGAYIWLCCGVLALLLMPLILAVIYIRGRSKIAHQEGL